MPTELLHVRLHFVIIVEDSDAVASISRLAWLEYPQLATTFLSLASCAELFELGVQLKICSRWDQVGLGHIVEYIEASLLVILAHVDVEERLLGYLVDTIYVIVDLVRLELAQYAGPAHPCPD